MSLGGALAIYFVLWWLTLFLVLPWGVSTQADDEDIVPGSAPSAPSRPQLATKLLATTLVSAALFLGVYWLLVWSGIGLDDVPFLPDFGGRISAAR